MADVAAAVSGVHAQILSAAEVSAALRVEGATRADVRRALWEDRTLVKTFGPRGTVHLLPTADLGRWMAALGAVPWRSPFPDGVRMTDDETRTVVAAIGRPCADAALTVDELTEAVGDLAGAWAAEPVMPAFQTLWPRWRQVTDRAAYAGVLCYGPDRARKVTYTRPPETEPVEPDEAVAWASGSTCAPTVRRRPRASRRGSAGRRPWAAERMAAHPALVRVELDGEPAYDLPGATYDGAPPRACGCCRTSTRSWSAAGRATGCSRAAAASGRWCRRGRPATTPCCWSTARSPASGTRSGPAGRIAVTVEPLRRLSAARIVDLEAQVSRLGQILEGDATLTIGEVSVGPHA